MAFWTCPACNRRVPGYAPACHCGAARTTASNVPALTAPSFGPTPFSTRDFSWQIWAALGVIVLAMGLGVWQLFRKADATDKLPPLLGVIDRPLPQASPKPKPTPRPTPTVSPA
jgi:hypothetical protein